MDFGGGETIIRRQRLGVSTVPRQKVDRNLVISIGERLLPAFDAMLMHYATTAEHEVFPDGSFPFTKTLEANWRTIRAEADEIVKDRKSIPPLRALSPDHHKIAVDDAWRSFFLIGYGVRFEDNCARCPETVKLVEQIPGLLSAFFSVMSPGAHVPRHTGPTKAILTTHLGLIVPQRREACHMQVGHHDMLWEEGKAFTFDDMYPHEVWNDTDEARVILLLHVKRPLRAAGALLQDLFFSALRKSAFVKDGLRNLERWKEQNGADEREAA